MDSRIWIEYRLTEANERLRTLQGEAGEQRIARSVPSTRRGLRLRLGELLVRAGSALGGERAIDCPPVAHPYRQQPGPSRG